MLVAARHQARTSFGNGRSLLPDSLEALERITHAENVAQILRQNIVQGRKVNDEEEDRYREHTCSKYFYLELIEPLKNYEYTRRRSVEIIILQRRAVKARELLQDSVVEDDGCFMLKPRIDYRDMIPHASRTAIELFLYSGTSRNLQSRQC